MVPVGMGNKEVCFYRFAVVDQVIAQISDSGSCVKDDKGIVVEPDLQAGSISPVTNGLFPRSGDRTPHAPEFYFHGLSQVIGDRVERISHSCPPSVRWIPVILF